MQASLFDNFDVCKNRSRGSVTSAMANEAVAPTKEEMRQRIFKFGKTCPDFTIKDVCAHFDKTPNAVSGRIFEMFEDGDIRKTGEIRQRCQVYEVVQ
jgi:hypothetical protein